MLLDATQPGGAMQQFTDSEQAVLIGGVAARLLVAALLGGIIGLDRELHRKPSGMRTNLLICFGAAMFTFLSPVIAGAAGNNKGQIAANVVQGIGFLGAGLILHNRVRVSGLTSAATVFAVASIGMACGAGLYMVATFATGVVLVTLESVGILEGKFGLKAYPLFYEVRTRDAEGARCAMLLAMDIERRRLEFESREVIGGYTRFSFELSATRPVHRRLLKSIEEADAVDKVLTFPVSDED
jgi:putative Mg2+ transporter-C (MgtC) family protein